MNKVTESAENNKSSLAIRIPQEFSGVGDKLRSILTTDPAMTCMYCVRPVWASDIEDITLFQRVQVPYRQVGDAC
jgi:hypothetical protein